MFMVKVLPLLICVYSYILTEIRQSLYDIVIWLHKTYFRNNLNLDTQNAKLPPIRRKEQVNIATSR